MSSSTTTTPTLDFGIAGPVFIPGDPGYEAEITGKNLLPTRTPVFVAGVTSTDDVAAAVRFARQQDMPVSVIGGGHGAATIASGLTITTRRMNQVRIDPAARTATFGAGATWKPVVEAAAEYGLMPLAGSLSEVGAVGYLLGGGTSPLGRSHGYSSDYLESLTVVTGTGEVLEASAQSNPELFWALRGGKRGLGIVTEATVRLIELPELYAGSLTFTEDQMDQVFRGWIDWARTADEQVTTSFATIAFPDLDMAPPPFRGKRISFLRFAYPGDVTRGEALAAPLRALGNALDDSIGILPAAQMDRIHNDPTFAMPAWEVGGQLRELDGAFADAWLGQFGAGQNPPFQVFELRHSGGAQRIAPPEGDAVANREAAFTFNVISVVPELFDEVAPAYAAVLLDTIDAWTLPVANVNFIGHNPVATPWSSEVQQRLDGVRRALDPDGLFGPR